MVCSMARGEWELQGVYNQSGCVLVVTVMAGGWGGQLCFDVGGVMTSTKLDVYLKSLKKI